MEEFQSFPKMPRLFRDVVITEKIDGTNAQIFIPDNGPVVCASGREVPFLCGSRNRWIFPENDNAGFARWAYENQEELLKLGPGRHFGEWWGQGIGRKYGLDHKRFSLFNAERWTDEVRPSCCHVVPVLFKGMFDTTVVSALAEMLVAKGSVAAPGFMDPEGLVVFHTAGLFGMKYTLKHDGIPKSMVAESK